MIEERQPLRAHKISLSNRSLGVITGVKDVVSFDLNEIILDTDPVSYTHLTLPTT